jgi:hypothetical protein
MKKHLFALLGLTTLVGSLVGSLGLPLLANAAPPPDIFKDENAYMYIHGATSPGSGLSLGVEFIGQGFSSRFRTNYCGEVAITKTSTRPNLGNSLTIENENGSFTIADISALPEQSRPTCSGQTLSEPRANLVPITIALLMGM